MKQILAFLLFSCGLAVAQGMPLGGIPQGATAAGCTAAVTVTNAGSMNVASGTSLSFSSNVASSGANTAVFLSLGYDGAGASISGCTYGGAAMTLAGTPASGSSNTFAAIYYIMNPLTGSRTVACTGTNVTEYYYNPKVLANVNSTTPIRAGSYTTAAGASVTIPSNSQDLSISVLESMSTPTSNQTYVNTGAGNNAGGADFATTPAASVTHTWSAGTAIAGASVMCKTN